MNIIAETTLKNVQSSTVDKNENIINEGRKLDSNTILDPTKMVENSMHMTSDVLSAINKYKGVLQYTTSTISGTPGSANSSTDKIIYNQISTPSLFNPYYSIPTAGITENVPLLDTTQNNDKISAKFDANNGKDKNTINQNISIENIDDCSISNLVRLSNMPHSILGQARYKYTDFMYCRDLGKISNNHLITLRRFSTPVSDNIFYATTYKDTDSNVERGGDVGRLITWFGNEENKIENILKYNYNATWKELTAKIQQLDSQETEEQRGIVGGLVNIFNPAYNQAVGQGRAPSALALILGKDGSDAFYTNAPYQGNPVVNGAMYDANEIYEPKDTIRSTHKYEGELKFEHEFTLTFNYKIRGYDNINAKSAFLDLLGNILAVTYKQGVFWGGEQRIIGAPQNKAGWNKAVDVIKNGLDAGGTFLSTILNGGKISDASNIFAQAITSGLNSAFGLDISTVLGDPKAAFNALIEKLKEADFGTALKGNVFNQLGRPAIYAFDSLLTNDAVGFWHVTIGNPLNPIVSMGNLIMTKCEITHSGPLGIDDFPTEITVVVSLKHGTPRDSIDIQRMYTKGRHSIYSKISDYRNIKMLFNEKTDSEIPEELASMSKTMSGSPTIISFNDALKRYNDKNSNEAFGWLGDCDSERIRINKDTLR